MVGFLKAEKKAVDDPNARVYSKHFQPQYFKSSLKEELMAGPCRRQLTNDAIPTTFSFTLPPAKRRIASERRADSDRLKVAAPIQPVNEDSPIPSVSEDSPIPLDFEGDSIVFEIDSCRFKSIGVQTGVNITSLNHVIAA